MKHRECRILKNSQASARNAGQRGSALITGLVFLVVLTLLGLSASSGSIQRELIARNIRDQNLALQAAEAALKAAEVWVRLNRESIKSNGATILPDTTCAPAVAGGVVNAGAVACMVGDATWWGANGTVLGSGINQPQSFPGVAAAPAYLIEYLSSVPRTGLVMGGNQQENAYYRITARGTGLSPNTVRMVRSIYRLI